eukprot:gene13707-biopygen20057
MLAAAPCPARRQQPEMESQQIPTRSGPYGLAMPTPCPERHDLQRVPLDGRRCFLGGAADAVPSHCFAAQFVASCRTVSSQFASFCHIVSHCLPHPLFAVLKERAVNKARFAARGCCTLRPPRIFAAWSQRGRGGLFPLAISPGRHPHIQVSPTYTQGIPK